MTEIISLKDQLKQNDEKMAILETENDKVNLELQELKDQYQELLTFNEMSKYLCVVLFVFDILIWRYLLASKNIKDCNSNARKLKENTDGAIAALENKIEGLTEDLANYQNSSRTVKRGEDMDGLDVASLRVDLDNIKRIDAKSKTFRVIFWFFD